MSVEFFTVKQINDTQFAVVKKTFPTKRNGSIILDISEDVVNIYRNEQEAIVCAKISTLEPNLFFVPKDRGVITCIPFEKLFLVIELLPNGQVKASSSLSEEAAGHRAFQIAQDKRYVCVPPKISSNFIDKIKDIFK